MAAGNAAPRSRATAAENGTALSQWPTRPAEPAKSTGAARPTGAVRSTGRTAGSAVTAEPAPAGRAEHGPATAVPNAAADAGASPALWAAAAIRRRKPA